MKIVVGMENKTKAAITEFWEKSLLPDLILLDGSLELMLSIIRVMSKENTDPRHGVIKGLTASEPRIQSCLRIYPTQDISIKWINNILLGFLLHRKKVINYKRGW
jgi:hypothetical protein